MHWNFWNFLSRTFAAYWYVQLHMKLWNIERKDNNPKLFSSCDFLSSAEQRKSGTFKDSTKRKVRRNNENGVTTITNLKKEDVQEDIQFLRELNKLRAKVFPCYIRSIYIALALAYVFMFHNNLGVVYIDPDWVSVQI